MDAPVVSHKMNFRSTIIDFNSSLHVRHEVITDTMSQDTDWDFGAVDYSTLTFASKRDDAWSNAVKHAVDGDYRLDVDVMWFQRDYHALALILMDILRQVPMYTTKVATAEDDERINDGVVEQVNAYNQAALSEQKIPSMCDFMMKQELQAEHWHYGEAMINGTARANAMLDRHPEIRKHLCRMTTSLWVPTERSESTTAFVTSMHAERSTNESLAEFEACLKKALRYDD